MVASTVIAWPTVRVPRTSRPATIDSARPSDGARMVVPLRLRQAVVSPVQPAIVEPALQDALEAAERNQRYS